MAQFNLNWTPNINANVISQRAEYRQKSVGGAFITSGFNPANDLSTSATTTQTPLLLDNVIYEFRIANICSEGGPTYNDNGIIESITFDCPVPSVTSTDTSITANITGLPTDITKVIFRLYASDGTTLVQGPTTVTTSSGNASLIFSGLSSSTTYVVATQIAANVNGSEVTSTCITGNTASIATQAPATCPAPTNLSVDIVNI